MFVLRCNFDCTNLQHRWAKGSQCTAQSDGGFKFNLLGWPVTAVGLSNAAGHFAVTGLALTSSMQGPHMSELFAKYQHSCEQVTGKSCSKLLSMSDAELAYRDSMVAAFSSRPLMCWFHLKDAVLPYVTRAALPT